MFEQVTRLRLSVESDGVSKAKTDLKGLGETGKATEQSLQGTNKTTGILSKSLIGLGLSVGGVALATKKVLGDWSRFNKAMLEVETIAGSTKAEMASLRLEALRLAQSLGVDAADAAGGFYQAISAGVATEDVAQFTKVAAQLAKGGLSDVASSTDLLTTALNAFKIEASEAESISDKLFKTVQLGKTNIPQLASSFGRAATAAAQSGVDINELLGIVAETTKQGVKTAEVFTMVKAAITALLNPSEDMAAIYEELGVQSGRQLIASRGLAGALNAVRNATAGNDAVTVKALRSVEAFSLAMSITGDNIDNVRNSTREITEALGDTARASETTSETVGVAFTKLGNSFLLLAENVIKAIDADATFGGWVSDVANKIADPDLPKAVGRSLLNVATLGTSEVAFALDQIDKQKNAEKQLEELREKSQRRIEARNRTNSENANKLIELNNEIYLSEKRIAEIQTLRAEGGRNKISPRLREESQSLKKNIESLQQQKEIILDIQAGLDREVLLRTRAALQISKLNQQLDSGKITFFEYVESSAKVNTNLVDAVANGTVFEQALEKANEKARSILGNVGKFATSFAGANQAVQKFVEAAEKYNARQATQIEINKILKKYEDEKTGEIEKQIEFLEQKIAQGSTLTAQEQGILNFLRKQLGVLKEQSAEKLKSKEQLDFESLVTSQLTERERALKKYQKELEVIKNYEGNITKELKEQAQARALLAYNEALERINQSEQGAIPQAIDEQTPINEEAARLDLQYATKLERLEQYLDEERRIILEATNLTAERRNELLNIIEEEGARQRLEIQRAEIDAKLEASQAFFAGTADLAKAFGEKGFKAYQALAIAEATISTYRAAARALSEVPFPFNFIAATGVIANGLAQVAQIKSQQAPKYQQGGIVEGNLFGGDQKLARVNSGEMILNKTQQSRLFELANNPLGGGDKKSGGNVTIVNNAPIQLQGEVESTKEGDLRIVIAEAVQQTKNELTNEAQEGGGTFFPAFEQSYGLARK